MDIVVILDALPARVDPGSEASATVRVRNAADVVDEIYVSVTGEPGRWAVAEPPSIKLFPGTEGTVQLRFRPPRLPTTPAGRVPFGVKATSRVDPATFVEEPAAIDVLPFHEATAELVPRTARAWRASSYSLRLANGGNDAYTATPLPSDQDQRLTLSVTPAELTVEPGGRREATVAVRARSAPLFGSTERLPFAVSIGTGAGRPPLVADGAFEQRPPLGRSPLPLLAVGAVLLVVALLLAGVIKLPGDDTSTPTPSGPTPTVPPSPSPTQTVPPSPSPTAATPSPTTPVVCGALFTTDVVFQVSSDVSTVESDRRACLFRFVMFSPASGEGPVALKVDGVDFFRFDMAEYDSIGTEGGGSGERQVDLEPAVPVGLGQVIELDTNGCSGEGCDLFTFSISAANAP
jgi:hypothetical protein